MKRLLCLLCLIGIFVGCDWTANNQSTLDNLESKEQSMYIKIGKHTLTAEMENNSSALALLELLKKGDLTIKAKDYSNFEKVGSLGTSLPRNDKYFTTEAGDLILYQGNQFVLYYDTNSWNFTKLGKVKDVTQKELKEILGDGDVEIILSLNKNQK